MLRRPGVLALAVVTTFIIPVALSSRAQAQQMGQGPPLPAAIDLKTVPVGSWAEYNMSVGQMAPMKSRMSLVAKSGATVTLEMSMEGGMMAMAGGRLVMQSVVQADQSKENSVKRILMQIADNDPMEVKVDAVQQRQFQKPNPKSFVKDETIKVAAGSFKTKHYHDVSNGEAFDYWISPKVPPFGLVRIAAEQKKGAAGIQGPVTFELTAMGKDAKIAITKPAKPMDQNVLMRQMMGGAASGGGAPHPGPGGAPPPVPGPVK